jgi:hypothetical protein
MPNKNYYRDGNKRSMQWLPRHSASLVYKYAITLTHLKSPAEQRFRESCKIAQHNAMDIITRLTNAKLAQMTLARKRRFLCPF